MLNYNYSIFFAPININKSKGGRRIKSGRQDIGLKHLNLDKNFCENSPPRANEVTVKFAEKIDTKSFN